jgi:prefoldin subunit 5
MAINIRKVRKNPIRNVTDISNSLNMFQSEIEAVWYNVLSVDAIKMACNSFKNRLSKVVAKERGQFMS